MKRGNPEARLQIVIAEFLRVAAPDLLFWSVRNESSRGTGIGGLLKAMGRHPGASDLMAIHDGLLICLEVKTETSKVYGTKKSYQSDDQKVFQRAVEARGARYFVVRNTEEVENALALCGVPLRLSEWKKERKTG